MTVLSPLAKQFDSPKVQNTDISNRANYKLTENPAISSSIETGSYRQPINNYPITESYSTYIEINEQILHEPITTQYSSTIDPSTTFSVSHFTENDKLPNEEIFLKLAVKKKYKPVALKVKPVIGELPDKFRIIRQIIGDPLQNLPILPTNPPPFTPTGRYTQERKDLFDKLNPGFLLPAERDLMHYFMMAHEDGFAWETSERGHFREDFFPPVDILVIQHKPWVQCNIPIPPGLYTEACRLVKDKIDAGVFEPSNSSYRTRWFLVVKKDGKSLRIVQSLEPLNQVTIAHSGVPPFTEQLAEQFAGRACSSMMDLYVGYDERALATSSRDLTTFQTPYGAMRLTTLPMGWTNSVPIFHDDVTSILQPEIPDTTVPYIDDVPIRGDRRAHV